MGKETGRQALGTCERFGVNVGGRRRKRGRAGHGGKAEWWRADSLVRRWCRGLTIGRCSRPAVGLLAIQSRGGNPSDQAFRSLWVAHGAKCRYYDIGNPFRGARMSVGTSPRTKAAPAARPVKKSSAKPAAVAAPPRALQAPTAPRVSEAVGVRAAQCPRTVDGGREPGSGDRRGDATGRR